MKNPKMWPLYCPSCPILQKWQSQLLILSPHNGQLEQPARGDHHSQDPQILPVPSVSNSLRQSYYCFPFFFFFALLHKVSEFGIQRYDIGYSMETIFGTPTQKVKFCPVKMLHLTKGETLEPPTSNLGDAKSR